MINALANSVRSGVTGSTRLRIVLVVAAPAASPRSPRCVADGDVSYLGICSDFFKQVMIGAARTMKHAVTLLGVPFSPHRIAVIGARLIALGASVFSLWAT